MLTACQYGKHLEISIGLFFLFVFIYLYLQSDKIVSINEKKITRVCELHMKHSFIERVAKHVSRWGVPKKSIIINKFMNATDHQTKAIVIHK